MQKQNNQKQLMSPIFFTQNLNMNKLNYKTTINLSRNPHLKIQQKLTSLTQKQPQMLQKLYLAGTRNSAQFINFQYFKNLKVLNIDGASVNDIQIIKSLKQVSQLQELSLKACKNIKDFKFPKLTQLKKITLSLTLINQDQLISLKANSIPSIQKLYLSQCPQINTLNFLTAFNQIKVLHLNHWKFIESQFDFVMNQLPHLQQLSLKKSSFILPICLNHHKSLKLINLKQSSISQIKAQSMFALKQLNLSCCQKLKSLYIDNAPQLKELNLSKNYSITKISLTYLPKLQHLKVRSSKDLEYLKLKECYLIKELDLHFLNIKTLQFQSLWNLQKIRLDFCMKLHTISMIDCPSFKSINFDQCKCKQTFIKNLYLAQLSNLIELKFTYCNFMNFMQKIQIKKCQKIQKIQCQSRNLILIKLSDLQQLKSAYFYKFGQTCCIQIINCKKILKLNLRNISIINSQVSWNQFPVLEQLVLNSCPKLDRINLTDVKCLKSLELINLYNIELISLNDLINLRYLNVHQSKNLEFLQINNCDALQNIDFQYNFCSEKIFKGLVSNNNFNLYKMNLRGCTNVQNFNFQSFSNLTHLWLIRTSITDSQISQISQQLQHLQQLNLSFCEQIFNLSLKNMKQLIKVNVSFSSIKNLIMKNLPKLTQIKAQKCDFFQQLIVVQCQITKKVDINNGTKIQNIQLEGLRQLNQLIIYDCKKLIKIKINNCSQLNKLSLLNMSENRISQVIYSQMSETSLQNIQKLQLSNNFITNVEPIINILKLQKITELILANNLITSSKAFEKVNLQITTLIIEGNPIKQFCFQRLRAPFKKFNIRLEMLRKKGELYKLFKLQQKNIEQINFLPNTDFPRKNRSTVQKIEAMLSNKFPSTKFYGFY